MMGEQGHADFAASRAYYATALLLEEGLTFSKHSAVHAAFGKHFAKTGVVPPHLHRYLLAAEDVRIIGDCDAEGLVADEKVQELIRHANEFLQVAERLLGTTPPAAE